MGEIMKRRLVFLAGAVLLIAAPLRAALFELADNGKEDIVIALDALGAGTHYHARIVCRCRKRTTHDCNN